MTFQQSELVKKTTATGARVYNANWSESDILYNSRRVHILAFYFLL